MRASIALPCRAYAARVRLRAAGFFRPFAAGLLRSPLPSRLARRRAIRSTTSAVCGGLPRLEFRLASLQLRLDDSQQVVAVLVGVLRRVPLRGQVVDQLQGHLELRRADSRRFGKREVGEIGQFVRETHHRQDDRVPDDLDGGQVLRVAEDHLRNPDFRRIRESPREGARRSDRPLCPAAGNTASRSTARRSRRDPRSRGCRSSWSSRGRLS